MRRDPVPAYYRIYQALRERIAGGAYKVGSKLPTDNDIMLEFSVSRHTARSAVEELVAQRMVRRFPGRGTFILEQDPASPGWGAQALEDLHIPDVEARFELHAIERIAPAEGSRLSAVFRQPPGAELMRISWSRIRDNGPIAFCAAHLPPALADRLPGNLADLLPTVRLIPLVEKHGGVQAFRVRQESSAVAAERALADRLQVALGTPLLLLQRTYFDVAGAPLYYSDLFVRSDRYHPRVELFRMSDRVELYRA